MKSLARAPHPGLWILAILVLAWLGMLSLQGLFLVLGRLLGIADPQALSRDPAVLGAIQILGLLPSLYLAQGLAPRRFRERGAPSISLSLIAVAFVAGTALQFVLGAFSAALGDLVPFFSLDPAARASMEAAVRIDSFGRALSVPFCVVLAAPLTEELLFRGAILPALSERHGPVVGLLGSALLFGAFHLHPVSVVYASLAGLVLGAVALRSQSVMPSFALHAGFNAIPILLPEALVPIPGFNTGNEEARLPLLLLVSASLLSVAMLLWLARLTDGAEHPLSRRSSGKTGQ